MQGSGKSIVPELMSSTSNASNKACSEWVHSTPLPDLQPDLASRSLKLSSLTLRPLACSILLIPLACGTARSVPSLGNGADPHHEYWSDSELRFEDRVYVPTVHTVQLFKEGFELAPPVLELGADESLVLRFDDFSPDPDYLSYTLVHCDAYWRPTDLPPSMYLSGAPNDLIPAARQSFNTLQPFLQYEVRIPNDMVRISKSGNYLLKVYRDNDPEDLVLTRRMLVFEQRVGMDARVTASRKVDLRDIAQQVDLTVRHPELPVQDPFGEIHVAMLQNMRWDDLRTGFAPRFVRGSELVYDYPDQGLFMGGNEFRNFDLKDLRYASQQIQRIDPGPGEGVYHAYLMPEEKRNIRVHFDRPDLNGKFFVRNDFFDGDPLGADYVQVHFTLPMAAPLGQEVFVLGGLSDWRCSADNRMRWDGDRNAYTATLLLKQGFYDYAFATLAGKGTVGDITTLEGSHFRTENDYLVLVYFSDRTQRCDRLVGVRFLNSRTG